MFENIINFFKKAKKKETTKTNSKETAKERLHLVLMQDRANVSADFLDLMRQEIIEVIKKYIDIDEKAMDVRLTNQENEDGTQGAPALYANIPIVNIKEKARNVKKDDEKNEEKKPQNEVKDNNENEEHEDKKHKNKECENKEVKKAEKKERAEHKEEKEEDKKIEEKVKKIVEEKEEKTKKEEAKEEEKKPKSSKNKKEKEN